MKKLSIAYLLLIGGLGIFFGSYSYGQSQVLTGFIKAKQSQKGISYASIRIEGLPMGTLSNIDGEFSITLPDSVYVPNRVAAISAMGYETLRIPITSMKQQESALILLEEKPYTLDEVYIYATELSAREMVQAAFKRIKKNYASQSYVLNTFYRHYCKEDGTYGRLIEAAIDVYDKKGHPRLFSHPKKKVAVNVKQLRRSLDFTRMSAFQHVPIALYRTLQQDYASYSGVLAKHLLDETFHFTYADTTYLDGEVIFVIHASGKTKGRTYIADIYLAASNFAMLKIEEQLAYRYKTGKRIFTRNEYYLATYQSFEGEYYLDHLLNEGQFKNHWLDSLGKISHTEDHFHHVEIMTNGIQKSGFKPFEGSEPTHEKMAKIPYDPDFWKGFTVLTATPLENNIKEDLTSEIELEVQFEKYHQQGKAPELQDVLASQQFAHLLNQQSNQALLLLFWDSKYLPGIKEILLARKLLKTYKNNPIGLVFLSLDENIELWKRTIRKRKLYGGQHIWLAKGLKSTIAKQYGVSDSPFFVLLDRDQKVVSSGKKPPKSHEIQELMSKVIDK